LHKAFWDSLEEQLSASMLQAQTLLHAGWGLSAVAQLCQVSGPC